MSIAPYNTDGLEWAWEIATMYPAQGQWSEEEYLNLTDSTNRLIEFSDGRLEFLAMPTREHQKITGFLYRILFDFVVGRQLGEVLFGPLRVYTRPGQYREPDIVFKSDTNLRESENRYYRGADLAIEVVSDDPESLKRDYETKVADYAEAKIPEYWIVDPQQQQITVLTLAGEKYDTHGVFTAGQTATSVLLDGFSVDVTAVFAAAKAI